RSFPALLAGAPAPSVDLRPPGQPIEQPRAGHVDPGVLPIVQRKPYPGEKPFGHTLVRVEGADGFGRALPELPADESGLVWNECGEGPEIVQCAAHLSLLDTLAAVQQGGRRAAGAQRTIDEEPLSRGWAHRRGGRRHADGDRHVKCNRSAHPDTPPVKPSMTDIIEYLRENRERHLAELKDFVRIPSVSAKSEHRDDVRSAAEWLVERMLEAGLQTAELLPTSGHPV